MPPGRAFVFAQKRRRREYGACANRAWGQPYLCPVRRTGGKVGKILPCPPERLGSYLRALHAAARTNMDIRPRCTGTTDRAAFIYGSPSIWRTVEGIGKDPDFIDQAADIVLAHGGSLSGEHGDGQSRAALLPKMFGPDLMQAFRDFKALWDPENRMNPGESSLTPSRSMTRLTTCVWAQATNSKKPETWFQFPADKGSFGEATLRCVGVGACRKLDHGTMCPSYRVTLEEKHSTRGRAHLLWEMLHGDVISRGWRNEEVKEALELCLSCKACKTECPVNVDMASWKAEFLAHYFAGRIHPLQHYAFGFMDRWSQVASWTPGLANLPLQDSGTEHSRSRLSPGVASERELPQFAGRELPEDLSGRAAAAGCSAGTGPSVAGYLEQLLPSGGAALRGRF